MFQFPAFAPCKNRVTALQAAGLSHSEIDGSRDICSYPSLFAAYHVLHRLCEPRHPPCALTYFISPTPASTMVFSSHQQSVITLILSAVFFRSKKSGNCILYLAIEYFSVFPQPDGRRPSDCSLQSSLCQNVKDLVAADSCPSRSGE